MSVSAVVVNYQTAEEALGSVSALLADTSPLNGLVVLVDNASGDGSADHFAAEIGRRGWEADVKLVVSPRNGGFGAGNNLGVLRALELRPATTHILFVNPDARIDDGSTTALLQYFERHPDVGIVGGRIRGPDGASRASGFRFPSLLAELESGLRLGIISWCLRPWSVALAADQAEAHVDWVSGAFMMVRTSTFRTLGGFDERFFLYYEETDLCRRALARGWRTGFTSRASAEHAEGLATGINRQDRPVPDYWFTSRSRYWQKHHGIAQLSLANLVWAAAHLSFRLRCIAQGKSTNCPPRLFRDFVRHNLIPSALAWLTKPSARQCGPEAAT